LAHGGTSIEEPPGLRDGSMGRSTWLICAIRMGTSCAPFTDLSKPAGRVPPVRMRGHCLRLLPGLS
jgi:hypothetical protein